MVPLWEIKKRNRVTQFLIELPENQIISTTCELLQPPTQQNIASVPVSSEDFKDETGKLSTEQLEELAHLQPLSLGQHEMMDDYVRLGHFHSSSFIVLLR